MPSGPRLILFHEERSQQAQGRVAVGEDVDHALTAANLFIEPLNDIRCAQALAIGLRQGKDCACILKASFEGGDRSWGLLCEVHAALV
jgi:hypothetical protein